MTDPTDPDELLVQAAAALAAGDLREANRLMDLAELATAARLARLTGHSPAVNVRDVTSTQLARRGQAIAEAKATTPLHVAASKDKRFRSLRGWARVRHLGRSSVSDYALGVSPCPSEVDRIARRDFPAVFAAGWTWPKGVKD